MYVKTLVDKIFSRGPISVTLAVVLSVLVVTATVGAATTISTNINTGGTLTVTGASTLTGATELNGSTTIGNAAADNITITGHATSSNTFATLGNLYVNGYATATAASGNFATAGTLSAVGLSTFTGGFLSSASSTMQNFTGLNATTTNATTTNALYVTGNSYVGGRATTTAASGNIATVGSLTVGSSGSAMAQIIKGTCNLLGMDAVHAASTTKAYNCAVTGVVSGDLVFTQLGTSTPFTGPNQWIIVGAMASSTDGFIDVLIWHGGDIPVAPSISGVGSSTRYLIIR